MNLKDMLSRVSYDDRHETTADVISLHSFDSAKCESEIKRLDVQAHEIRNQLRTERAKHL